MNDRTPPHDRAAERAVLGSMLMSVDAIGAAIDILDGRDFYLPQHQIVYDAIVGLYDHGKAVDQITTAGALQLSGDLGKVGGPVALHELVEATVSPYSAAYYARIVADKAVARRVIEAGGRAAAMAYAGTWEAADLAEEAAAMMDAAAQTTRTAEKLTDVYAQILDPEEETGLGYGLGVDLARALSPLTPGQLVVIGARPGVGKSVAGAMVARSVAWDQGGRATIASMEMSAKEILTRILASHCTVALDKFKHGGPAMTERDLARLAEAYKLVEDGALAIEDTARASLADLRSMIRHHRPNVLVVDYLGLMRMPNAESRQQAVSETARGLKELARKEGVTVVALAQLNRESSHRTDKRPTLTDLRESGEIEQAADTVLLLHRPDLADQDAPPGEAQVIVAKQRNGIAGFTVTMAAQMHYARFVDMATGV